MQGMINLITSLQPVIDPALTLVAIVATLMGVLMVGNALIKAYAMSSDSGAWRGQGDATIGGVVWSLVIGGILVSSMSAVQMFGNTIFAGDVNGGALLYQSAGMTATQKTAMTAIMALFTLAGYIAFVRGWVILNKHFNGVIKDGVGMGLTHIIGGTILIYLNVFLEVLQNTTGLQVGQML